MATFEIHSRQKVLPTVAFLQVRVMKKHHPQAMGKYDALRKHLEAASGPEVSLDFSQIADLVGGLPASAHNHRAWWSNEVQGKRSHARAWMEAGWRVADLSLGLRWVRFVREGQPMHTESPYAPLINVLLSQAEEDLAHIPLPHEARDDVARTKTSREILAPDSSRMLFVIPCSKRKSGQDQPSTGGPSVLDDIPEDLAARLASARAGNRARAMIDERTLVPAWKRYRGSLYEAAGSSIRKAAEAGFHVLIISGGYGVIRADEAIGMYEAVFDPSRWPRGLIEECIVAYAARHGLTSALAFAGASTSYASVIRKARWRSAGISARLITPESVGGGSMVKVPRAIGEAIRHALIKGTVESDWIADDGTTVDVEMLA